MRRRVSGNFGTEGCQGKEIGGVKEALMVTGSDRVRRLCHIAVKNLKRKEEEGGKVDRQCSPTARSHLRPLPIVRNNGHLPMVLVGRRSHPIPLSFSVRALGNLLARRTDVKYRGLFINDELPVLWNWAREPFRDTVGGIAVPGWDVSEGLRAVVEVKGELLVAREWVGTLYFPQGSSCPP